MPYNYDFLSLDLVYLLHEMKNNTWEKKIEHIPVLYKEILDNCPENAKIIIDGTLGYGGHALGLLAKYPSIERYYWFDLDPNIFENTRKKFGAYQDIFKGIQQSYTTIQEYCQENNISWWVDYSILDLGVNMEHFKDKKRGFSVQWDEILDMRFDNSEQSKSKSAKEILNSYSEPELSRVFQEYADFTAKKSEEIAKKIIKTRKITPLQTTQNLKDILAECWLGYKASIVIFQAIRIETNQEILNLKTALATIPHLLNSGGIFAIITFHSTEDRIVKYAFKDYANTEEFELASKKAIQPHYTEVQKNRPSRSAKLRLLRKI